MSKHTPGPWKVQRSVDVVDSTREHVVVHWMPWEELDTTRQANARLIAAAPDMLEALEGVVTALTRDDYRVSCGRAETAIAKARGEA